MLQSFHGRIALCAALAVGCSNAVRTPLPEFYGMYSLQGGKITELSASVDLNDFDSKVRFIVFSKESVEVKVFFLPPDQRKSVSSREFQGWDDFLRRSREFSNAVGMYLSYGVPPAAVEIPSQVGPYQEKADMVRIVPRREIPPGLYQLVQRQRLTGETKGVRFWVRKAEVEHLYHPTTCFLTGHGERSLDDTGRSGYSNLKSLLEKNNYVLKTIPGTKPDVFGNCAILVVAGPRFDYTKAEVSEIKSNIEKGGRALLMMDPPIQFDKTVSENVLLVQMLAEWGVRLNKDLVLDVSGNGKAFGLSEVVPLVSNYSSHAITREQQELATAFPLARTIETNSLAAENLFASTTKSYATSDLKSMEIRINPERDRKGPHTLAAAGTVGSNHDGRYVVVGSSGWVANNILGWNANANANLVISMLKWLKE